MLVAEPTGLLSNTYAVTRDGLRIAEVQFNDPDENGSIRLGDQIYPIAHDRSWPAGERRLFLGDQPIAVSRKPDMTKDEFFIDTADATYALKRAGFMTKTYTLERGGQPLGTVARQGWVTRRIEIAIDESMPLHLQLFAFWLLLMLWHWEAGS